MEKKYQLGLALSGGGVRGVAHIGVLKALEENGIEVDCIIGTSAGAIIGALYTSGKTPDEMLEFVQQWSLFKVIKVGLPVDGLTSLAFLKEQLLATIEHDTFEQLQKKLYVGLTNLNTGELEIIDKGCLSDVIMAASAIPLVFKPVEINETIYVDGGLMCNMPIHPLDELCEHVIGVNLMPHGPVDAKSLHNVLGIGTRVFNLAIVLNSKPSLELCDIVIEPEKLREYNIFSFNKKLQQEIYDIGYNEATLKMPLIKKLLNREVIPRPKELKEAK